MNETEKRLIASQLCKHYVVDPDQDEKLEVGFGTVVARNNTENQEHQNVLVMSTNEEIMHFKAITELARVGLEQRDK